MSSNKSGAGYGNHGGDESFGGQDGAKGGDHKAGDETTGPNPQEREQPQDDAGEPDA